MMSLYKKEVKLTVIIQTALVATRGNTFSPTIIYRSDSFWVKFFASLLKYDKTLVELNTHLNEDVSIFLLFMKYKTELYLL